MGRCCPMRQQPEPEHLQQRLVRRRDTQLRQRSVAFLTEGEGEASALAVVQVARTAGLERLRAENLVKAQRVLIRRRVVRRARQKHAFPGGSLLPEQMGQTLALHEFNPPFVPELTHLELRPSCLELRLQPTEKFKEHLV